MEFETYKEKFETSAKKNGLNDIQIQECLEYAKPLIQKKFPIIYNTSHFSKLVGIRKTYIKRAAIYTKSYYRSFTISKRSGKPRQISEPLPNLKLIQDYILKSILENEDVSIFAKAYKRKSNLIENTRYHVGQPKVVTLDIKDFFSSITKEDVFKIFLNMGYSELLSDLFSKLCTLNYSLPQGASTSPYLSNLFLKNFDNIVADYCLPQNIKYTRYADDITFSGIFDHELIINFIRENLSVYKLELNESKIKVMLPNQRQIVTGIIVNEKIQIPRKERLKIRQEVYHIRKRTLESHIEEAKITQRNYLIIITINNISYWGY